MHYYYYYLIYLTIISLTCDKCCYSVVIRVLGWVCEGRRINPDRCQLHGLGVRHFKVSGGVPSPPEQRQPNGRLSESKQNKIHFSYLRRLPRAARALQQFFAQNTFDFGFPSGIIR